MNTYKYLPRYSYSGPTLTDPFREELSIEEQARNIELFYTDVVNQFEEFGDVVSRDNDGVVSITTTMHEQKCDKLVKGILNGLDLFCRKG
jgi:hypothetical protein